MIDGKPVRKFLFGRWSAIIQAYALVEVEGFNKDHALKRLCEWKLGTERREWEFLDELDFEHFVGKLGESLPMNPFAQPGNGKQH
jgi:hypothetical protein